MKKLVTLPNLLIVLLLAVVLFQTCGGNKDSKKQEIIKVDGKKYELLKHEIDTQYITKEKTVYKQGEDIAVEVIVHDTIPQNIDTTLILKDFFAKRVYNDTLKLDDSLGLVTILDTISENKILSRTWTAKVIQKEIKETIIVKDLPKTQAYFGGNATFNRSDLLSGVGVGLLIKNKKDRIYQISTGLAGQTTNLNPYLNFGMYWKIKLKK
jgi:hypothetical protein